MEQQGATVATSAEAIAKVNMILMLRHESRCCAAPTPGHG
jgi:hypothetical protein